MDKIDQAAALPTSPGEDAKDEAHVDGDTANTTTPNTTTTGTGPETTTDAKVRLQTALAVVKESFHTT